MQFLQQETYLNSLTDDHDANTYFADLPSTYERRNPYIFTSNENNPLKIVDLLNAYDGIIPKSVESFYIEGSKSKSIATRLKLMLIEGVLQRVAALTNRLAWTSKLPLPLRPC